MLGTKLKTIKFNYLTTANLNKLKLFVKKALAKEKLVCKLHTYKYYYI